MGIARILPNHSYHMAIHTVLLSRCLFKGILLTLLWSVSVYLHAESLSIKTGETDIGVEVFPAKGEMLFIWQPHEVGTQSMDQSIAQQLAANGIETWLLDIIEAYFLPNTPSSMDRIPAEAFAAVLQAAMQSGKKVIAASSGRGAIPLLRGIRQWQLAHPDNQQLLGTILISPKLFVETPDPGLTGKLMPIAEATNQTMLIMQPDKSPWFWKLEQTLAGLQKGGSDIYLWPLRDMRDRFYFRPDATDSEKQIGEQLATRLMQSARLLANSGSATRRAVASIQRSPDVPEGKKDRMLAEYKGDPTPPPLRLHTVQNKVLDLAELKGKVVLVNFWATWCPPCVHEMPSMQRLTVTFANKPFTILGVNMAEDADTITNFVEQRVKVTFPIVLDKDGKALKAWRVFAFPTSYVVDKKGRIRYALFGGIEWDADDIKQKLAALIAE